MSAVGLVTAACGALSALYGVFKYAVWKDQTTPEQKREQIDQQVDEEEQQAERTGRP